MNHETDEFMYLEFVRKHVWLSATVSFLIFTLGGSKDRNSQHFIYIIALMGFYKVLLF